MTLTSRHPLCRATASPRSLERITKDGLVLAALNQEQARISLLAPLEQDIEAMAVALLRFFKNPAHERRVRELIGSNGLGQSL
jgi:N-methylhydantoinase A